MKKNKENGEFLVVDSRQRTENEKRNSGETEIVYGSEKEDERVLINNRA